MSFWAGFSVDHFWSCSICLAFVPAFSHSISVAAVAEAVSSVLP